MSNYGADTNTERMYDYLNEARGADLDAREEWCLDNGYDPTDPDDGIEMEWREHKSYLSWLERD